MATTVKELTVEELRTFINETVDMRLEERLGDPDAGLEVKLDTIETIRKSRKSKVTISAAEVAEHLGLKW